MSTIEHDDPETRVIAALIALMIFGVFAYALRMLFETTAVWVLVSATSAAGSYLFLPYAVGLQERDSAESAPSRGFHSGAASVALLCGGTLALGLMFVFESPTVPFAATAGFVVVAYGVLSMLMPWAPR